jgi:hypothetical protein
LEPDYGKWYFLGFTTSLLVAWYLGTVLLLILLAQYLFSKTFKTAAETILMSSMRTLGLGVVVFVAIPLAALIAAVTVIGLPITLLLTFIMVFIGLLGNVLIAVTIANWINVVSRHEPWKNWQIVVAAFLVFIVSKLVFLTPFVGPLLLFALGFMTLGGIAMTFIRRKNKVTLAAR